MSELKIDDLRKLCVQGKIIWKDHAAKRMQQRHITTYDVLNCIATGEIIEEYSTDYPAPSCLVFGVSVNGSNLHVVCSVHLGCVCIITAYFPTRSKWENNYKTRKVLN